MSFAILKGQLELRSVAHLDTLRRVKSESPSGLTKQGQLIQQAIDQAETLVRDIHNLKVMP